MDLPGLGVDYVPAGARRCMCTRPWGAGALNAPDGLRWTSRQFPGAPAAWRGGPGELVASEVLPGLGVAWVTFGRSPVLGVPLGRR